MKLTCEDTQPYEQRLGMEIKRFVLQLTSNVNTNIYYLFNQSQLFLEIDRQCQCVKGID